MIELSDVAERSETPSSAELKARAYAATINATVAYGAHINARPKICTIVHTVPRWS